MAVDRYESNVAQANLAAQQRKAADSDDSQPSFLQKYLLAKASAPRSGGYNYQAQMNADRAWMNQQPDANQQMFNLGASIYMINHPNNLFGAEQ